ncbi:hypothetical protein DSS3PM1_00079 [Bacteriophage DSS3_PM1]|nr:hypothetical protein DSS3PM1_00079 [Bacteriophage DSS3_PM1]
MNTQTQIFTADEARKVERKAIQWIFKNITCSKTPVQDFSVRANFKGATKTITVTYSK